MDGRSGPARGRILDAGALVAIERGDRRARVAIADAGRPLVIPAPVLAEVWRDGARQARLAVLVKDDRTIVEVLDAESAKAVGVLLGRTDTSDIADASVVLAARRYEALVITTDAADIRRLDPELPIAEL
jgi:predicted nucleic acid-binding protein